MPAYGHEWTIRNISRQGAKTQRKIKTNTLSSWAKSKDLNHLTLCWQQDPSASLRMATNHSRFSLRLCENCVSICMGTIGRIFTVSIFSWTFVWWVFHSWFFHHMIRLCYGFLQWRQYYCSNSINSRIQRKTTIYYSNMNSMNWDGFRYFTAAAGAGSLSSAANKLHSNQSTVGRHIDALEEALGVKLFQR